MENGEERVEGRSKSEAKKVHKGLIELQHNEAINVEEGKEDRKVMRKSLITKEYIVSLLRPEKPNIEKPIFKLCAAHAAIAYFIKFNTPTET